MMGLLLGFLEHDDWEVRSCALHALGSMPAGKYEADMISRGLSDANYVVRARACEALGKHRAAEQAHELMERLEDSSLSVRCSALWALGEMGQSAAVAGPKVVASLRDSTNIVRVSAVKALARLGVSGCYAGVLVDMLHDQDVEVQCEAIEALGSMGPYALAYIEEFPQQSRSDIKSHGRAGIRKNGPQGALPCFSIEGASGRPRDRGFCRCESRAAGHRVSDGNGLPSKSVLCPFSVFSLFSSFFSPFSFSANTDPETLLPHSWAPVSTCRPTSAHVLAPVAPSEQKFHFS